MPVNVYKSFKHGVLAYLSALAITYILLSPFFLGHIYDSLLFFPDRKYYPEVEGQLRNIKAEFETNKEDIYIPITTKIKIHAWYFKTPRTKTTFLISHGNGGNICDRLLLVRLLLNFGSVLVYDYEGYGASDGKPSRSAICADGLAVYDYLVSELRLKPKDVVLYGESLGCAVCCQISKARPVGGIILQSGWASLLQTARDKYVLFRLYPDSFFSPPLLDNVSILCQPHPPLLLIHGQEDNILPCRYSQEMFTKACEPKRLVLLPHASHNNIGEVDKDLYCQSILNFMNMLKSAKTALGS